MHCFFVASRSRFVPIRSLSHHQVCDFWELIICCNYHYCTLLWAVFVRSLARIEMIFQLRTQTSIRRWCAMVLWSDPIRSEIVNVQHCTYHSEIDSRPNVYFFIAIHKNKQTVQLDTDGSLCGAAFIVQGIWFLSIQCVPILFLQRALWHSLYRQKYSLFKMGYKQHFISLSLSLASFQFATIL